MLRCLGWAYFHSGCWVHWIQLGDPVGPESPGLDLWTCMHDECRVCEPWGLRVHASMVGAGPMNPGAGGGIQQDPGHLAQFRRIAYVVCVPGL